MCRDSSRPTVRKQSDSFQWSQCEHGHERRQPGIGFRQLQPNSGADGQGREASALTVCTESELTVRSDKGLGIRAQPLLYTRAKLAHKFSPKKYSVRRGGRPRKKQTSGTRFPAFFNATWRPALWHCRPPKEYLCTTPFVVHHCRNCGEGIILSTMIVLGGSS